MAMKGIGGAGNNCGYPDLVCDVDANDSLVNATICGLWNAVYALGWAVGPVLGGGLYELFEFQGYAFGVGSLSLLYAMVLSVASLPFWSMYKTVNTGSYERHTSDYFLKVEDDPLKKKGLL